MSKSKKNVLVTSVAVITAAALLLGGGTYAYLQGETEDVVNTFNTNEVLVELDETTGSEYEIVPGMSSEKDPTVTVNATVPAYVYVEVTDATDGLVTYELADGWTALDGVENVYYREVEASDAEQTFAVLKDNTVSYDAALANSDMLNEDGTLKDGLTLTFKASAVQKEPFANAVDAYFLASGGVTFVEDETSLVQAAAYAEAGEVIVVADGEYDVSEVEIAEGATLTSTTGNAILYTYDITEISADNVTLSNLDIRGLEGAGTQSGDLGSGLKVTGSNVTFENCSFLGGGDGTYNGTVNVVCTDPDSVTTFTNCEFSDETGGYRALYCNNLNGTLVVDGCTVNSQAYTVHVDSGTGKLIVKNSVIRGWTSFSRQLESAEFTNVTFEKTDSETGWASGYNFINMYCNTTFNSCTFLESTGLATQVKGTEWLRYFNDCTYNGTAMTADNFKSLPEWDGSTYTGLDDWLWNYTSTYVNGELLSAD